MSVLEAVERRYFLVNFLVNCQVREEHLFVRGGTRRGAEDCSFPRKAPLPVVDHIDPKGSNCSGGVTPNATKGGIQGPSWLNRRFERCLCGRILVRGNLRDVARGSGRPPSGQGRLHTAKFTNLVNFGVLLAQPDKAVYGRVGDALLFACRQPCPVWMLLPDPEQRIVRHPAPSNRSRLFPEPLHVVPSSQNKRMMPPHQSRRRRSWPPLVSSLLPAG